MEFWHACGWKGRYDELTRDVWNGIWYGLSCPECGDVFPFFYDEGWDDMDDEREPIINDHSSRMLYFEESTP